MTYGAPGDGSPGAEGQGKMRRTFDLLHNAAGWRGEVVGAGCHTQTLTWSLPLAPSWTPVGTRRRPPPSPLFQALREAEEPPHQSFVMALGELQGHPSPAVKCSDRGVM